MKCLEIYSNHRNIYLDKSLWICLNSIWYLFLDITFYLFIRCYICGRASMTMLDSNVWYIKPKTHRWWFFSSIKEGKSLLSIHHYQPVLFHLGGMLNCSFLLITIFLQYLHKDSYLDTYIHTYNFSLQSINSEYYYSMEYEHLNSTKSIVTPIVSFSFFFRCLCMIAHFVWKWFTSDFRKSP